MKKEQLTTSIVSLVVGLGVGVGSTHLMNSQHNSKEVSSVQQKSETREMQNLVNGNVLAVDWQQNSGEINALRYEAYKHAKEYVDELCKQKSDKPYAVTLDIDETVLDNSPHAGYLIKHGEGFTKENFHKWVEKADAKEIAGAKEFTDYAKSKGFEVFYVSNRDEKTEMDATIENMKKVGFVNSDKEHILLKSDTSKKHERWDKIKEKYNLAMYCGDNLCDFPNGYDKKSNKERCEIIEKEKYFFGTKYIMLPNASYGDFEGAIYNYDYKKSPSEKIKDRLDVITSFE